MTTPTASVVIPTRNRPDKIGHAVASVLANDYPDFDVTVIDQSTTSATEEVLRPLMLSDPRLRYVHVNERGASRAVQCRDRETTGNIIAFTDDDCIVPNRWIEHIVHVFESDDSSDMVYGCVRPASTAGDDAELTPYCDIEAPERLSRSDGFRVFGMSANFAARRRLFSTIGGFDENLGCGGPLPGGEDFDLAYRTYRTGSVILLRPEVSVLHDGRRERSEWPTLIRNYGIGDGAFYSKHVRCGDGYAMLLLSRRLLNMGTRVVAKRLLRRRGDERLYLRGLLIGVREGLKFKVDRHARQYVSR